MLNLIPATVETGRYRGVDEESRICEYCHLNEVEDEVHFILFCPLYDDLREILFQKVHSPELNLLEYENGALIQFLFDHVFAFAEYIYKAWDRRRRVTYR